MDNGLLKKQFVGRDGFYWWLGQVVASKFWQDNNPPKPVKKADELPGLKRRVKVRIFGYHTASIGDLPDEDLPWAYCMFPVTSGGASGGMSNSVNFSGGEFVFGFFLDGEDGQQPIIMGVMDKSSQLTFPKEIPDVGFSPFQGYTNGAVESRNNMKKGGASSSTQPGAKKVSAQAGTSISRTVADESATNENDESEVEAEGPNVAYQNAKITSGVKPAQPCADDNPAAGIKLALTRAQAMSSFVQKQQGVYLDPLTNSVGDAQKELERASENVSGYVKDIMAKVRAVATKEAADKAARMSIKLPIDQMEEFKDQLDDQLEGLGCAFENIIGGLENTLNGLLNDMMGKVTGDLDCVISDVLGNMLDSALGSLNQVMGSLTGILDSMLGVTDSLKVPVVEAADFVGSLKTMFSCEGESSCNPTAQTNMLQGNMPEAPSDFAALIGGSMGLGRSLIPEPVGGILNAASDLSDSIKGVGTAVETFKDNIEAGSVAISNAGDTLGGLASGLQECNPFAGSCEPPLAIIFGGGVTQAAANAIVNRTGNILGVDLNGSPVMNRIYSSIPSVIFQSNCGQGAGAEGHADVTAVTVGIATTTIGTGGIGDGTGGIGVDGDIGSVYTTSDGVGVTTVTPFVPTPGNNTPDGYIINDIIMDSPGQDYPAGYDGSVGGNGNTFADGDQTIIRDEDGNNIAIKPERGVCFEAGSTVFIPIGGGVEFPEGTVDQKGEDASGYQLGRGLTEGSGFIVSNEYCIFTPTPDYDLVADQLESMGIGDNDVAYPVVMELGGFTVDKVGISYNEGDTITLEGDGNSLTFEPEFSVDGSILGVPIPYDKRGQGFTDIPLVTINTKTGAGGLVTPYLRIKYRGRDMLDQMLDRVDPNELISVVDCVGKFDG